MAKGLPTLIRLQKRELDELRRRMKIMQDNRQSIIEQSEQLQKDLEEEVELAAKLANMGNFFGDYSDHIKKRRQRLAGEVAKLDRKIERLSLDISDSFGEMKKYEIAYANYLKREKAKATKREQERLDEVAMRQYLREMQQ